MLISPLPKLLTRKLNAFKAQKKKVSKQEKIQLRNLPAKDFELLISELKAKEFDAIDMGD